MAEMTPVPAEAAKNTRNVAVNKAAAPVPGFKVAAVHAGIRYRERPDLALIAADSEGVAAGVFTRNQFAAAPVLLCREHLKRGQARAILVNAGIANACTGEQGFKDAERMAELTASTLNIGKNLVFVCSCRFRFSVKRKFSSCARHRNSNRCTTDRGKRLRLAPRW